MAPLEGITTYVFRAIYRRHFDGFDKYFTPFLASKKLAKKEKNEVLPENNEGSILIPQILANIPDTFLSIAEQLKDLGYEQVNLNLGCPSGTVVGKNRGSGQLKDLIALESFLDEIFDKCDLKISIKTRIGMADESEWERILELYKKYPISELIIHPRLREDWYKGSVRMSAYGMAYDYRDALNLCYNGDIVSAASVDKIISAYPDTEKIMIGRGIIANPCLLSEINGSVVSDEELNRTKEFLNDLTDSYEKLYGLGADLNVLHKMKEIWYYIGLRFPDADRLVKKIMKTNSLTEYKICVRNFFDYVK